MRLQRIGLIAFLTVLATVVIDNVQFIPNPKSQILNSQVLAQTVDERKAQADRLHIQGAQMFFTSQMEAAIQSWQQALIIYQEIKDRSGEADSLFNLGLAYKALVVCQVGFE
jgi:TPR repeat protein